jgi:hypothetical protein
MAKLFTFYFQDLPEAQCPLVLLTCKNPVYIDGAE